ncbi:hypothetical protein MTP99_019186 [Tenebrio molitor]|nr:hypothetical protein MTP99_019186 [Tenebrio molitor]
MRYGEALEDFLDRWLQGIAFIVVADSRRFSLISSTRPSTSLELMLNSGPRMGFIVLMVRISAEGISGIQTPTTRHFVYNFVYKQTALNSTTSLLAVL